MALSISDLVAQSQKLPPNALCRTRETVTCPMLPSKDGSGWGYECTLQKLDGKTQIYLLGRVKDAVATDSNSRRESRDTGVETMQSDGESWQFWETAWLLTLGCVDPVFTITDAAHWLSTAEENGIPLSDVAQFLAHHVRGLNEEAPGLQDVGVGLRALRRMPAALGMLEAAYEKGGNALDLLLEGRTPDTDAEMAQFIERWGDIIMELVVRSFRRRAKIEAEETSAAILEKAIDFLVKLGTIEVTGNRAQGEGS